MNSPREDWLLRRQQGVGGSDVAAILGISPWATPLDVFLSKVEPPADREQSEPAYWGTVLEDVVAREYATRTQRRVQRINQLARHPERPWMIANLDRVIVTEGSRARLDDAGLLKGADGLLECKTASAYKASDWGRADDDEAIPVHYAAQAMWYLAVTGAPWIDVACLIGGQKYVMHRMERDEDTINSIRERCEAFWHDHVLKRVPPPAQTSDDVVRLFPADSGEAVEATVDVLQAYNDARALREQIAKAETDLEAHIKTMKVAIGEASALTLGGKPLVTFKKAKDGEKTDWQMVAKAAGAGAELIRAHTSTTTGSRRFVFCKQ